MCVGEVGQGGGVEESRGGIGPPTMLQQPLMVAVVTTISTWKEEVMVVEVEVVEI